MTVLSTILTGVAVAAVSLVLGFILGVIGTLEHELKVNPLPEPVPLAPTYDEMKQDIALTDSDWIMRIGTA